MTQKTCPYCGPMEVEQDFDQCPLCDTPFQEMSYLEQLQEIRSLLEQIDESQLCEKCMGVLAPVLQASSNILNISVNEKAKRQKNNRPRQKLRRF